MTKIIALISQKGGVGKSTIAQSLAVTAHNLGYIVMLADCDSAQQTSYDWYRWRKKKGLDKDIFLIDSKVYRTINECLDIIDRSKYDLIIIDGPARVSEDTLKVAQMADLLVQPTSSSSFDLKPCLREFKALENKGINKAKLLVVANRLSNSNEFIVVRDSCYSVGLECLPIFLFEKSTYKQPISWGRSTVENVYSALKEQALTFNHAILKRIGIVDSKI